MAPGDKGAPRGPGRKIIPFPFSSVFERDENPISTGPPGPGSRGLDAAWSEELKALAQELPAAPIALTLEKHSAEPLLGFIETTGLADLARIEEDGDALLIRTARPTVGRLILWQALDLRLDFKVRCED